MDEDLPSPRRVLLLGGHPLDLPTLHSHLQRHQLLHHLLLNLLLLSVLAFPCSLLFLLLLLHQLLNDLRIPLLLPSLRSPKQTLQPRPKGLLDLRRLEDRSSLDDVDHAGLVELDGDAHDGVGVQCELGLGQVGERGGETGDLGCEDVGGEGEGGVAVGEGEVEVGLALELESLLDERLGPGGEQKSVDRSGLVCEMREVRVD